MPLKLIFCLLAENFHLISGHRESASLVLQDLGMIYVHGSPNTAAALLSAQSPHLPLHSLPTLFFEPPCFLTLDLSELLSPPLSVSQLLSLSSVLAPFC